jgi:hypothetical protein
MSSVLVEQQKAIRFNSTVVAENNGERHFKKFRADLLLTKKK